MPCRSDDGCGKIEENQGGATRRKGAQGLGKTVPKAGVLVTGEWQVAGAPGMGLLQSSTRNRLQLKESSVVSRGLTN